jgi:hypothetical protein
MMPLCEPSCRRDVLENDWASLDESAGSDWTVLAVEDGPEVAIPPWDRCAGFSAFSAPDCGAALAADGNS